MSDIATLGLAVDSRQVKTATGDLDKLTQAGSKSEKSSLAMSKAWGAFSGVLAGVSIAGIAKKLIDTEREFGVLTSSLKTATGSTGEANKKFAELEKTASKLPESLNDTVNAFIKLKNLGLDPSERSILSYSNTAAAMGKSLNQMIEAVADASTGEFERLKEFGIRASKEGQNVTFTFKGVETTIRNTSDNIQKYLLRLGEVDFAGASADRMATLDGALSNLGDAWDGLFRKINSAGVGDLVTEAVRDMADSLGDPATIAAAQALAGGVVKSLNAIASAATNTVNVVKFLAEELAASVSGPASDDIVRLQERLENLQKARSANFASRLVDGFTDKELDAEINKLQRMIFAYHDAASAKKDVASTPAVEKDQITALQTVTETTKKLTAEQKAAAAAEKQRLRSINDTIEGYEREATILGKTSTEVAIYDLYSQGATKSDLDRARAALALVDAYQQQQDMIKSINDEIQKSIDEDLAVEEKRLEGLVMGTEKATDEMSVFAKRAAENMQDAFADFLFDPFKDGLDGMLKNFGQILQRMIAEAAAAQIFDAVLGKQGAGGQRSGGVDFGSVIGAAASFFSYEGGGFTGPGLRAGGLDGRGGRMAMVHPNETIIDHTKGQKVGGGNTFNFDLSGMKSAKEVKESMGLLQRGIGRAVSASGRYM